MSSIKAITKLVFIFSNMLKPTYIFKITNNYCIFSMESFYFLNNLMCSNNLFSLPKMELNFKRKNLCLNTGFCVLLILFTKQMFTHETRLNENS
jgi:hypothetical protein